MKAIVVNVYDGDTVTLAVKWLDLIKQSRVRLAGIDTPEIKSRDPLIVEKGFASKAYLETLLPVGKEVIVQALIVDNYGRMLGTIYQSKKDTISVNQMIIDNGFGKDVSIIKQLLQIERGTFKF